MARLPRVDVANTFYHILNRANARLQVFFKEEDYILFENILVEGVKKYDMCLLAYCLMPNHFHLMLYPKKDKNIQKFMQWVTLTHTQRWHVRNDTVGTGHLYQGRYKSFLVEEDVHLLSVIRYIERNPLRANLVKNIENWNFSSLVQWKNPTYKNLLTKWPIQRPKNYIDFVNTPLTKTEEDAIRYSIEYGKPYGKDVWTENQIKKYKLEATNRKRGRPKKGT